MPESFDIEAFLAEMKRARPEWRRSGGTYDESMEALLTWASWWVQDYLRRIEARRAQDAS
jgi:hypothetical protein